jgi:hypothetical protein
MGAFLGFVIFAAFVGAYAGGFYFGLRLTRPLRSRYEGSNAPSYPQLRPFLGVWVWCLRIVVALVCGQVFSLPL